MATTSKGGEEGEWERKRTGGVKIEYLDGRQ